MIFEFSTIYFPTSFRFQSLWHNGHRAVPNFKVKDMDTSFQVLKKILIRKVNEIIIVDFSLTYHHSSELSIIVCNGDEKSGHIRPKLVYIPSFWFKAMKLIY